MTNASLVRIGTRIAALIALVTMLLMPETASAHRSGGPVLPPNATPKGYSLTDMAREMALFTSSGNDSAYLPHTPFQPLYFDPATGQRDDTDGGWAFSGANSFCVKAGTIFYVPLQNVNDSPPILGTFPVTNAQARPYFFRESQLGARGYKITVDGVKTPIRPRYLAGPVTTPPMLDGGGTHMITLGAFVGPLPPGRHTVRITGGLHGDLLHPAYEIYYFTIDFTYQVTVAKAHHGKHHPSSCQTSR